MSIEDRVEESFESMSNQDELYAEFAGRQIAFACVSLVQIPSGTPGREKFLVSHAKEMLEIFGSNVDENLGAYLARLIDSRQSAQ